MATLTYYSSNTSMTVGQGNGHGSGWLKSPGAAFVLTDDFGEKSGYTFVVDKNGNYAFAPSLASDIEDDFGWHKKGQSRDLSPGQTRDFLEIMRNPAYAGITGPYTSSAMAVKPDGSSTDANNAILATIQSGLLDFIKKWWIPGQDAKATAERLERNKGYVNAQIAAEKIEEFLNAYPNGKPSSSFDAHENKDDIIKKEMQGAKAYLDRVRGDKKCIKQHCMPLYGAKDTSLVKLDRMLPRWRYWKLNKISALKMAFLLSATRQRNLQMATIHLHLKRQALMTPLSPITALRRTATRTAAVMTTIMPMTLPVLKAIRITQATPATGLALC